MHCHRSERGCWIEGVNRHDIGIGNEGKREGFFGFNITNGSQITQTCTRNQNQNKIKARSRSNVHVRVCLTMILTLIS